MSASKAHKRPFGFGTESYAPDYVSSMVENIDSYGVTDTYSTGLSQLDRYLGGGFGKKGGYEVVLVYGSTGVGKSRVGIQMMLDSVRKNIPQAWIILENSVEESIMNFHFMNGGTKDNAKDVLKGVKPTTIRILPKKITDGEYTLDDIYDWIAERSKEGRKLFLFDHIQYAFDSADYDGKTQEWREQRAFTKRLQLLAETDSLTIVMVSHIVNDTSRFGNNSISGNKSISEIATKAILVSRPDKETLMLTMTKSRHTTDWGNSSRGKLSDCVWMRVNIGSGFTLHDCGKEELHGVLKDEWTGNYV